MWKGIDREIIDALAIPPQMVGAPPATKASAGALRLYSTQSQLSNLEARVKASLELCIRLIKQRWDELVFYRSFRPNCSLIATSLIILIGRRRPCEPALLGSEGE